MNDTIPESPEVAAAHLHALYHGSPIPIPEMEPWEWKAVSGALAEMAKHVNSEGRPETALRELLEYTAVRLMNVSLSGITDELKAARERLRDE